MIFHVLGPLEAHSSTGAVVDFGTRKAGTVLGVLLLHPNAWVRTDELVRATWPEHAVPAAAKANLKTYVSQLRCVLPPFGDGSRVEARPGAYRLRVGTGELDADRAAELAADARAAIEAGDHLAAAGPLRDALALWRGRPFEGLASDEAFAAAGRLDDLRHDLEESLAEVQLAVGRRSEAIATLRRLTAHDPLREGAWTLLVRTLVAAGRRGEAVAAHRAATAVLADELGVEPGPELTGALTAGTARPRREIPRDVPFFVGRAPELALVRQVRSGAPVVIDGMSGVGKTALAVRAAHQLAGDFPGGQLFVTLRAGAVSAADALARVLRGLGISGVPADVDERAALWRSELAARRVLLVLDDAGDARQVLPLLPGDEETAVLITTRQRGWRLPGETRISLEPLCRGESEELLRQATGRRAGTAPTAVVRACGGLPSALLIAAARLLSRPFWTAAELASWCADPGRLLGGLTSSSPLLGAAAQRAFRGIAALPPEFDCGQAAQHLGVDRQDARALLEDLVDHHLLDGAATGRYRIHPLVRELARRTVPAGVRAA